MSDTTTPKNKTGRKPLYDPSYIRIAEALALEGATMLKIAKALGVTRKCLYEWVHKHKSFGDVLTAARDRYQKGEVEDALSRRATGYNYVEKTYEILKDPKTGLPMTEKPVLTKRIHKHMAPSDSAIQFYLRNRDPQRWPKDSAAGAGAIKIYTNDDVAQIIEDEERNDDFNATEKK